MPKRTIADARRAFDELTPSLNPEMYRRLDDEVKRASAGAITLAGRFADERAAAVLAERTDVLNEWCTVRDGYAALAADAADGRISARDVTERLDALRRQHRALERHGNDVGRAVEVVERIESDPEGWADETFYAKYPHMTPDFSF